MKTTKNKKIKDICIKTYAYEDGLALLAGDDDIQANNYFVRRATKKYMIYNFAKYFTHSTMGVKDVKKWLQGLSRNEIYKELEWEGAIFF